MMFRVIICHQEFYYIYKKFQTRFGHFGCDQILCYRSGRLCKAPKNAKHDCKTKKYGT